MRVKPFCPEGFTNGCTCTNPAAHLLIPSTEPQPWEIPSSSAKPAHTTDAVQTLLLLGTTVKSQQTRDHLCGRRLPRASQLQLPPPKTHAVMEQAERCSSSKVHGVQFASPEKQIGAYTGI